MNNEKLIECDDVLKKEAKRLLTLANGAVSPPWNRYNDSSIAMGPNIRAKIEALSLVQGQTKLKKTAKFIACSHDMANLIRKLMDERIVLRNALAAHIVRQPESQK